MFRGISAHTVLHVYPMCHAVGLNYLYSGLTCLDFDDGVVNPPPHKKKKKKKNYDVSVEMSTFAVAAGGLC